MNTEIENQPNSYYCRQMYTQAETKFVFINAFSDSILRLFSKCCLEELSRKQKSIHRDSNRFCSKSETGWVAEWIESSPE